MRTSLVRVALVVALPIALGPILIEGSIPRSARADESGSGAMADWAAQHFRIQDPAHLSDEASARIYDDIVGDMIGLYRLSREPHTGKYAKWPRYVTAPYQTAAHGDRYHSIYARAVERRYGLFESAGQMPAGTVVAKDSFSVSSNGQVHPGPLSIMEKLPAGASPETGDWRFSEIMPDGSVYGISTGPQADNVAHCVACHRVVAGSQDWLYFPPPAYRTPPTP